METLWYILLTWVLATYVVLDGMDFGVGMLHLRMARNPEERQLMLRSIGPVWDGNEVWLLVAGGTLFLAFPQLLATAFSGFYLPLMLVLWLLIFRALGIELQHHLHHPLWQNFWDVAFSLASFLLALFFGVALGNVLRGVSFDSDQHFFAPLFTNFRTDPLTGILDGYTLLVGLTAVVALGFHGCLWTCRQQGDPLRSRAKHVAQILGPLLVLLTILLTVVSFWVQPLLKSHAIERPWGFVFPALGLTGLGVAIFLVRCGHYGKAFLGSCLYLYGMIATASVSLYPYVLPGRPPTRGLTLFAAAAPQESLIWGLLWWIPGILLACIYFLYIYTRWLRPVSPPVKTTPPPGNH